MSENEKASQKTLKERIKERMNKVQINNIIMGEDQFMCACSGIIDEEFEGLVAQLQKQIEDLEHKTPEDSCIYKEVNEPIYSLVEVEKAIAEKLKEVLEALR